MSKQKKGYVHIYAGDGKGKSTACCGLAIRAAARDWKIGYYQFLKSGKSAELKILSSLPNVEVVSGMPSSKFVFNMNEEEKAMVHEALQQRLEDALQKAREGAYDLLILDEAMGAISTGMIDEESILDFLKDKPESLEFVMSGRNPSEAMIQAADYYSEVCMRKHPFESEGLGARPGIEF